MIETQSIALHSPSPAREARSHVARNSGSGLGWTIDLSIDVDADGRRIFHALTVPEYLEAWICVPGQAAGSSTIATQEENGFRLEHFSADRLAFKVVGSYLYCHQRKIRLFWRKMRHHAWAESLVDFRLRGNFGSSILELRHTALASADEYFWHRTFWLGSLAKLASLLQSA